jgi:Uma2 family endonuclease
VRPIDDEVMAMAGKNAATKTDRTDKRTVTNVSPIKVESWFPDGGQPTWEIAALFPAQGTWTVKEYFDLDHLREVHPLLEFTDGRLEVLSMPGQLHQLIIVYLLGTLQAFTAAHAPGLVLFSGMKVRLRGGKYREPDILYMKAEHFHRRHEEYWDGADLVMEVVSPDPKDRQRDLEKKPSDYARARIPEYWIIDPKEKRVRVLTLVGKTYKLHGDFAPGTQATSVLLPGFAVAVDQVLNPPGSRKEH